VRPSPKGFRPGAYLRLVLRGVPHQWANNFDPTRPLLIGGLLPSEDSMVSRCRRTL
jgi:ribosome biogenesis protein BMS1